MAHQEYKDELDFSMGTVPHTDVTVGGSINELMVCPYDESHVVAGGKYHMHVRECRRKTDELLKSKMKICPYNPAHHVHESVLSMHITLCPEYYKYCMDTQEEPESMRKTYNRYKIIPKEKRGSIDVIKTPLQYEPDWDDDDEPEFERLEMTDNDGNVYKPLSFEEYRQTATKLAKQAIEASLVNQPEELDWIGFRRSVDGENFTYRDLKTWDVEDLEWKSDEKKNVETGSMKSWKSGTSDTSDDETASEYSVVLSIRGVDEPNVDALDEGELHDFEEINSELLPPEKVPERERKPVEEYVLSDDDEKSSKNPSESSTPHIISRAASVASGPVSDEEDDYND